MGVSITPLFMYMGFTPLKKREIKMAKDSKTKQPTELDLLKKRADTLGITYSPNIGLDTLKRKINSMLQAEEEKQEADSVAAIRLKEKNALRNKAKELVRVIVVCNNPNKRNHNGEIFAASNSLVGTIKKFVPFSNENGWYVPRILLNVIEERKCQILVPSKDGKGRKTTKAKLIKEFTVTKLPSLTDDELATLAKNQKAKKTAKQL